MVQWNPKGGDESGSGGGRYIDVPGRYRMRVAEIDERQSRDGCPQWKVTLEVVEGEHSGKRVTDYITFSDAARWRANIFLARLGFDTKQDALLDIPPESVQNLEIIAIVGIEEYRKNDGTMGERAKVLAEGYERLGAESDDDEHHLDEAQAAADKAIPHTPDAVADAVKREREAILRGDEPDPKDYGLGPDGELPF